MPRQLMARKNLKILQQHQKKLKKQRPLNNSLKKFLLMINTSGLLSLYFSSPTLESIGPLSEVDGSDSSLPNTVLSPTTPFRPLEPSSLQTNRSLGGSNGFGSPPSSSEPPSTHGSSLTEIFRMKDFRAKATTLLQSHSTTCKPLAQSSS